MLIHWNLGPQTWFFPQFWSYINLDENWIKLSVKSSVALREDLILFSSSSVCDGIMERTEFVNGSITVLIGNQ